MKRLFALVITVLIALPAFNQFNFGIKAGVNSTSLTMNDIVSVSSGTKTYTIEEVSGMNFGFHGGVFGRISISKLFVQPEILFSTSTSEYKVTDVLNTTVDEVKQKFNKIDIPVLVGVKFGPARINVGPVGSFNITTPEELIDDPDFEAIYGKMSFGYQAGLGVDLLGKLTIDLRYEGSLKKYQTQIENAAGTSFNLDDRPSALLLSVGIMF
ncbi:MAG: porin family protein [Bacteroidota bacterium]